MGCQKAIITNPCGHQMRIWYIYCGGHHVNNSEVNMACYEATRPIFEFGISKYIVGAQYCNQACKAFAVGWECCSCNSRLVKGYIDPSTKILVHKTPNSLPHAFCRGCRVR